jgi:starvation-inducible DNA-binding protein
MPSNLEIMNQTVASLIDLKYQAKNAHWNYRGMLFYQFHLLFDRISGEYDNFIDRLAERLVGLGGTVSGTIRQAAEASGIPDEELIGDGPLGFSANLLMQIERLRVINLGNIDVLNALNDQTTMNILCELQETLDSHKYLVTWTK